jgi:hypothetical protein
MSSSYGTTIRYNFSTNAFQTFVVPTQVNQLFVVLFGAAGGITNDNVNLPGFGAKVTSTHIVVPNSTLYIFVGGKGSVAGGGWNGGGYGSQSYGAGGGGATDIRGSIELSSRVAVAGGGGGAFTGICPPSNGGNGGDPDGKTGTTGGGCSAHYGSGGTQSTFGTNSFNSSFNGALGKGGSGFWNWQTVGGGGGYFG